MPSTMPKHLFTALALAACLEAAPALAGTTMAVNTQAEVLESIQFSVLLDMDFGKVAVRDNSTGGAIVIDPASNGRTCSGNIVCTGSFGTSRLELTGSDTGVQINFEPTFTLTGPGDPIVAEPQFPGGSGAVVNLTGGHTVVNFGAIIRINPGQTPGLYSGSFTVNLEYN